MAGVISGEPVLMGIYQGLSPFLERSRVGRSLLVNYNQHKRVYYIIEKALLVFVLVMLIRFFLVQPFHIPSSSMSPTLQVGDKIFIFRLPYLYNATPELGDIIVFRPPESAGENGKEDIYYVKRVVGLPGDIVSIDNHRLYINEQEVREPEVFQHIQYESFPRLPKYLESVQVPEYEVLVFGDNSADSVDSRYWGPVPLRNITGEVFLRFWPFSRLGVPE